MVSPAFTPITLPNGTRLKNRIAKAAMAENMAEVASHNQPTPSLMRLYEQWGKGGAGLILSGHVMVDPMAMSSPCDVLLAKDVEDIDEGRWREYISSTQRDGAQFWFQINHPGRQVKKGSGLPTYAPSAVPLKLGSLSSMFEVPIAMTEEQIQDVIRRFAWTARKAEELGASGAEIHAAHGYLLSQFLSPLTNKRTDKWGGSLENRARLLFEVVRAVRSTVSATFGVGVKINSADFQRGGFDADDLYWVVEQLNSMKIDLLELSGGSFEAPAMMGSYSEESSSTVARKAYFLEAAEALKKIAEMPILVTGGIKRRAILESVVNSSDNFIAGVGTALGLMPDLPNRWMRGEDPVPELSKSWVLSKTLGSAAVTACVQCNLYLIGKGYTVWMGVWPALAVVVSSLRELIEMRSYKRWIHENAKSL